MSGASQDLASILPYHVGMGCTRAHKRISASATLTLRSRAGSPQATQRWPDPCPASFSPAFPLRLQPGADVVRRVLLLRRAAPAPEAAPTGGPSQHVAVAQIEAHRNPFGLDGEGEGALVLIQYSLALPRARAMVALWADTP